MLEGGEGSRSIVFRKESVQVARKPVTLAGVLNGVELKDSERRSVLAADAMRIPIEMKGVLAGADIFLRDGIFRANDVLGFDSDQAVEARDLVRTDPSYEIPWIQFSLLKEDPVLAGIAIYKRAGMSNEEIAQKLQIDIKDVDEGAQVLNDYGIFGNKKDHEIRYAHRRKLIRGAIIQNPALNSATILDLLDPSGINGLTTGMIKYQREILINEGLIERKREAANRGKTVVSMRVRREAIISIFYEALRQANLRNESVVVTEIKKSVEGLSDVPDHTLLYYYHQMDPKERPQLKLIRTRKNRRITKS